ncbi:MAG: hypothetical protein ACRC1W_04385 [Shewanella sp.]
MLTHHVDLIRAAVISLPLLFIPVTHSANAQQIPEPEPSLESLAQPTQTTPFPLGTLLDSNGKPMNVPNQVQSGLEHSPTTVNSTERPQPKSNKATNLNKATKSTSTQTTKSKKLTRKQQLASREHVANDPNCRWLDKRMEQLEALLGDKPDTTAKYQADELNARQKEWQCLKCGAEGPAQNDHSQCQYRR